MAAITQGLDACRQRTEAHFWVTSDREMEVVGALAGANVYVANAVIATYGEQVVDTFYVKDMFGLKYHSESKQRALDAKLRKAIIEGAERADR